MRRLWLVFAQTTTVCLAVLFVVATLKPDSAPVRSVTGAGDALIAAHLAATLAGASPAAALAAGLAAARRRAAA